MKNLKKKIGEKQKSEIMYCIKKSQYFPEKLTVKGENHKKIKLYEFIYFTFIHCCNIRFLKNTKLKVRFKFKLKDRTFLKNTLLL